MPSFDIVSEIDHHELTNAVDQSNREIAHRYDFKGSDARVQQEAGGLTLEAETEFQLDQMQNILFQKLAKRGIDIRAIAVDPPQTRGQRALQRLHLREGIDQDTAKRIVKAIKDSKLKVQAAVQGERIRVSGKKRDDLQRVIALLREQDFDRPLQFTNFRD